METPRIRLADAPLILRLLAFGSVALAVMLAASPSTAAVTTVVHLGLGDRADDPVSIRSGKPQKARAHRGVMADAGVDTGAARATRSTAALRFDGKGGVVLRAAPAARKVNFGIEAWVKPANEGAGRVIVNYGGDAGIGIEQQNDGVWGVVYGRGTVGFKALPTDRWTHVALVVSDSRTTLFVDGKASGSADLVPWGVKRGAGMGVGTHPSGKKGRFTGAIDEARAFTFESGSFTSSDLLFFQDAATANLPTYEASLVFDERPKEDGLTFDRDGTRFVSSSGKPGKASWAAVESRLSGMPWMRSMRLTFTDDRFRHGNMPVVDLEVEYSLDTWGGITAYADRARGSGYAGMQWAGNPSWRTARFRLNDAYFGARDHGTPDNKLQSDGYDLRLYAPNAPLHVRAVRVKGYPLEGDPASLAWSRLIKIQRARAGDSPLLNFTRSSGNTLSFEAKNLARVPADLTYRFQVRTFGGEALFEQAGDWSAAAEGSSKLAFEFDSGEWAYGPYTYHLTVRHELASESEPPLAEVNGRLAVYDGQPLAKARPGEFLYGIQHTKDLTGEIDQAWFAFLGSDFVRGLPGHGRQDVMSRFDEAVPLLASQGMTLLAMVDPPKPGSPVEYDADGMEPEEREKQLKKLERFLETLARKHRRHLTYFELGNEPDLKFFYPGPVEEYVDSFRRMRAAVKRGNPDAVVMTGGLCFFGEEGDRRARRIIELLAPDGVDAWAFHGHGPGYEAERDAYLRQVEAVEKFGGGHLPYIETESGFGAKGDTQIMEQARTAIEKFVYAQRVGMPKMAWFALHFKGSTAYTTAEHQREPRPAALAYRGVVQRLRHHQFVEFVELAEGRVLGHVFHDLSSNRAALVMWSGEPGRSVVRLQIGQDGLAPASAVRAYDMWGNASELPVESGVVECSVGEDTVFVTWDTRPGSTPSTSERSPLLLVERTDVYPGDASVPSVTARAFNAGSDAAELTLTGRLIDGERAVDLTPSSVAMEPGKSDRLTLEGVATPVSAPISWPRMWRVFAPADLQEGSMATAPDSIVDRIGRQPGRWVFADAGHVELTRVADAAGAKSPAVLMATVWSPTQQTVRIGAAADWWMRWSVNGEAVYDTLRSGNGGAQTPTTHMFDVRLQPGHNVMAVEVLSGSQGWSMTSAGPAELDAMLNPESPSRRIELQLEAGGNPIATLTRPLPSTRVALPLEFEAMPSDWDDWRLRQPLVAIGEPALENPHLVQPDERKWWQGDDDLSAMAWARTDSEALWLVLAVRDGDDVGRGDGVEVSLAAAGTRDHGGSDAEAVLDTRAVSADAASADQLTFERHRDPGAATTWYRVRVPRAVLPGGDEMASYDVAATVHDDDGFGPKQRLIVPRLGDTPLTVPPAVGTPDRP